MKRPARIGILTAGGDCPGLNAAIRGVGKTAILEFGMEVYGISNGYRGLIEKDFMVLTEELLSGILTLGGTILRTSREKPFKADNGDSPVDKPKLIRKNYEDMKLDCVVCIGGNGTMKTAAKLADAGLNVVGLPKTIDNDVWGTDQTFGFDSALTIATDSMDKLHTTANSHKRTMVIEIMGHHTGWLTLYSGVAGGADVILIPEVDYKLEVICDYLEGRARRGKPYSIVAVAEGIDMPKKKKKHSAGQYISKEISERTGLETREIILGYIQRGGTPSPADRILATRYGAFAAELIANRKYGRMVALRNNEIESVPLSKVAGKLKTVPPNHSLIKKAVRLDTCFGRELNV
jgi:ATP-dependent phosphofructokinase / diphosphate-dependent phosphofructokinase